MASAGKFGRSGGEFLGGDKNGSSLVREAPFIGGLVFSPEFSIFGASVSLEDLNLPWMRAFGPAREAAALGHGWLGRPMVSSEDPAS
jgi:hypothetical protein